MEEQPTLEGYTVEELPVEEIELQPLEGDENDEAIGAEVENPSKE